MQIWNSHALGSGLLGDYCDGELFHTTQLFQEDPSALQIQLYYDELEVCNPLGSIIAPLHSSYMIYCIHLYILVFRKKFTTSD